MSSTHPELALERLLLALEADVLDVSDEELMAAAKELGMNPDMKGSAAFFGILKHFPSWLEERNTLPGTNEQKAIARDQVLSWLAALTPQQAGDLRNRFGIDQPDRSADEDDVALHALARELAALLKKQ